MAELNREKCEACRSAAPKVEGDELQALMGEIPDWSVESRDGILQLERRFGFPDFAQALAFTNKVGELADS